MRWEVGELSTVYHCDLRGRGRRADVSSLRMLRQHPGAVCGSSPVPHPLWPSQGWPCWERVCRAREASLHAHRLCFLVKRQE